MIRQHPRRTPQPTKGTSSRSTIIQCVIFLGLGAVFLRLFYWQIIKGPELQAVAQSQYTSVASTKSSRGRILTADGHVLVGNQTVYTLFAQPHILQDEPKLIATALAQHLSTDSAKLIPAFTNKLADPDKKWVALQHRISKEQKEAIQALDLYGIGFDPVEVRFYPEASMAAQIAGFVGKNTDGYDQGYFGIEGEFDLELQGADGSVKRERDPHGRTIWLKGKQEIEAKDGRDVILTIERDTQYLIEKKLKEGIEKYGAVSGEVAIMNPKTGAIIAMASFPNYHPQEFYTYPSELYRNPLVAESYEPGSTFKVLTVAAGIDSKTISPETICTRCAGPRKIGGFTIKTWNDEYQKDITIKDGLAKSDNTAMIYIAEEMGTDTFVKYLDAFKIGEASGIEIEEDSSTPKRKDWKPIDLATSSFGQGIVTTGMQMLRAVGAVANGGVMMKPHIVQAVVVNGTPVRIEPQEVAQPIRAETAEQVTDMMVHAAHKGEAQWTVLKNYTIAGKTGTAQIPVAGHYDEEKTIASFIGFAPAHDPQFVMLVKLREPQSSPWASETAAPLWYEIAQELFIRMGIPPDKISE